MPADLTPATLTELRRLAEAATPGPWTRERPPRDGDGWPTGVMVAGTPGRQPVYATPPGGSRPSADASFIAAANPSVVLALLDRLEKLERVATALEALLRIEIARWEEIDDALGALEKEDKP